MAIDVLNTLQSPGGRFELTAHRDPFPTEAFDSDEASIFQNQLNTLISNFDSAVLSQLISQRQQTIARVATLAKAEMDGKTFGGVNAGDNEIGFSILRPGQIRAAPASGASENNWYFTPSSTGWVDWIGDGANNNYTVTTDSDEQVVLVLALMDQESGPTEVSGVNVQEFGRNMDMLPRDANDARLMDNDTGQQIIPLPALVGRENDQVYIRLRMDRVVERQPRLFGFNFSLGNQLDNEDY